MSVLSSPGCEVPVVLTLINLMAMPTLCVAGLVFVYIVGDVAYLAKTLRDNGAEKEVMARSLSHAVAFHGIASLAVPSFIIHTAVKQS